MAKWEAGRALDLEIERVVFGRDLVAMQGRHVVTSDPYCDCVPRYSRDVAAAWQVVEALRARGVAGNVFWTHGAGFAAVFWPYGQREGVLGYGATAPLAICRAALATVEAGPDG